MKYSEEDLETLDIDWFASDKNKNIAHFASAGIGFIPETIVSSVENNELIFNAIDFCDLPIEEVRKVIESKIN